MIKKYWDYTADKAMEFEFYEQLVGKRLEIFLKRAKNEHGDKYDYTKVDLSKPWGNITIGCNVHGDFKQSPVVHMKGKGCPECDVSLHQTDFKRFSREYEKYNRWRKLTNQVYIIPNSISDAIQVLSGKAEVKKTTTTLSSTTVDVKNLYDLARKLVPQRYFMHTPTIPLPKMDVLWETKKKGKPFIKRNMSTVLMKNLADLIHGGQYSYLVREISHAWLQEFSIECKECKKRFSCTMEDHLLGKGCSSCSTKEKSTKDKLANYKKLILDLEKLPAQSNKYKQLKDPYQKSTYDRLQANNRDKSKNRATSQNVMFTAHVADVLNLPIEVFTNSTILTSKSVANRDEFIQQAKKVHGDKYDYDDVEFINETTNVIIHCDKDGHGEFEQLPRDHLQGKGCKFKICSTRTLPLLNSNAASAFITTGYLLDKICLADNVLMNYLDSESAIDDQLAFFEERFFSDSIYDAGHEQLTPAGLMPIKCLEDFEELFEKFNAYLKASRTRSSGESRDILDQLGISTGKLREPLKKSILKHAREDIVGDWKKFSETNYGNQEKTIYPILNAEFFNSFWVTTQDIWGDGETHLEKNRDCVMTLNTQSEPREWIFASYDSTWRTKRAYVAEDPKKEIIAHIREAFGIDLGDLPKSTINFYTNTQEFFKKRSWFSIFQDYPNELRRIIKTEIEKQQ